MSVIPDPGTSPMVSVIIPVYNGGDYLSLTLESVRGQTYREWEALVIDDGSTDRTAAIAESFSKQDPRIRYMPLGFHSGRPAVPRNFGMRRARGKYLAFLDADDLWLPDKLSRQVRVLEADPSLYLVYSQCYFEEFGAFRHIRPHPRSLKEGKVFRQLFLSFNFIHCLTVLVRNEPGSAYLFDEDPGLKAIEDFDLWLLIAQNKRIGCVRRPLAVYRIHDRNISEGILPYFGRILRLISKWRYRVPCGLLACKYALLVPYAVYLLAEKITRRLKKTILPGRRLPGGQAAA